MKAAAFFNNPPLLRTLLESHLTYAIIIITIFVEITIRRGDESDEFQNGVFSE